MMPEAIKLRILDAILTLCIVVQTAFAGWAGLQIVGLLNRVSVIESSRYTDKDAADDKAAILKEMNMNYGAIREALSEIKKEQAIIRERLERQDTE